MDDADSSRRPWLTHERTVLVLALLVTAFGLGWLGWQAQIVQHRRFMLKQIKTSGAAVLTGGYEGKHPMRFVQIRPATTGREISRIRSLIGDESVNLIRFNRHLTAADSEAIKAFPEANVDAVP
jgi:hypothetical protein